MERQPIIFPEQITLPSRKFIRHLARNEKEAMALRKKYLDKDPADLGHNVAKQFLEIEERGWKAREKLLTSDLAEMLI